MMTTVLNPFKKSLIEPVKVRLPDPMNLGVKLELFDWTCESTKASLVGEKDEQKIYVTVMYCGKRKKTGTNGQKNV